MRGVWGGRQGANACRGLDWIGEGQGRALIVRIARFCKSPFRFVDVFWSCFICMFLALPPPSTFAVYFCAAAAVDVGGVILFSFLGVFRVFPCCLFYSSSVALRLKFPPRPFGMADATRPYDVIFTAPDPNVGFLEICGLWACSKWCRCFIFSSRFRAWVERCATR